MNSQLQKIFQESIPENKIDNELYTKYDVKKGLRNEDGTGVLIGLTRIAD
ncbi:MAG: citrate synthase, partial [Holdemania filiformis]